MFTNIRKTWACTYKNAEHALVFFLHVVPILNYPHRFWFNFFFSYSLNSPASPPFVFARGIRINIQVRGSHLVQFNLRTDGITFSSSTLWKNADCITESVTASWGSEGTLNYSVPPLCFTVGVEGFFFFSNKAAFILCQTCGQTALSLIALSWTDQCKRPI